MTFSCWGPRHAPAGSAPPGPAAGRSPRCGTPPPGQGSPWRSWGGPDPTTPLPRRRVPTPNTATVLRSNPVRGRRGQAPPPTPSSAAAPPAARAAPKDPVRPLPRQMARTLRNGRSVK
eukprot:EG_transcript_13019